MAGYCGPRWVETAWPTAAAGLSVNGATGIARVGECEPAGLGMVVSAGGAPQTGQVRVDRAEPPVYGGISQRWPRGQVASADIVPPGPPSRRRRRVQVELQQAVERPQPLGGPGPLDRLLQLAVLALQLRPGAFLGAALDEQVAREGVVGVHGEDPGGAVIVVGHLELEVLEGGAAQAQAVAVDPGGVAEHLADAPGNLRGRQV